MSTNTYILLTNSDSSLSKKFRVVQGTYLPKRNRPATNRRTANGKSDHQEGKHFWTWSMSLRVMASETDGTYGTLANLVSLIDLNNPGGTPTNVITYQDPLGSSFSVYLDGDVEEDNLTPYLDGNQATFIIPIAMLETL